MNKKINNNQYLIPDWPAPAHIGAVTTTRQLGCSLVPFESNNLGMHVGDDPAAVKANRALLVQDLQLPAEPEWLNQSHTNLCINVKDTTNRMADAAINHDPKRVLAIMTADCQPIVLCNQQGSEIAAIHAGWRGLVSGIVENTLQNMQSPVQDLMAWIGPAICGNCYEVGPEVLETYTANYPFAKTHFKPQNNNKWLINLASLTEQIFINMGVMRVYKSNMCTFEQKNDFFSYRRDKQTGRIATLIWFKNSTKD